jgi:hypothetical protein
MTSKIEDWVSNSAAREKRSVILPEDAAVTETFIS